MSPNPTGHYAYRDDGLYLQFGRIYTAPIEDVWYSVTNPTAMERWIGTYTGNPRTGAVRFRMSSEEGAEWEYATIRECDPPHRFRADVGSGETAWRVFAHLHESAHHTTLAFGARLRSPEDAARYGARWDYYLDRLGAVRARKPLPEWSVYDDVLTPYYRTLIVPDRAAPIVP